MGTSGAHVGGTEAQSLGSLKQMETGHLLTSHIKNTTLASVNIS